ncbi:MAG: TPM domain-containing protein [Candidatus Nanoarchaeia archaeon]
MFKMNKKGEEGVRATLLELLVMIGVLGILVFVFISLRESAENATADTLCRSSVLIRGKATVSIVDNLVEFEKITPLACNTRDLGTLKGDREEVKKQIADYSTRCWWQFAEGSVADLFKVDRKEKSCFVCYTFNIKDGLDEGIKAREQIFEELSRPSDTISSQEFTNFLVSEAYNPAIIYGGGTKNYYGIEYEYALNLEVSDPPREIRTSRIESTLISGHVMDYWFKINDEAEQSINEVGAELQLNNVGNLLVIVAEDFNSMDKSDAREIIEDTRLNSNSTSYDSVLILVSIKQKKIRIHAGSDLSIYLKEYKMNEIMDEHFKSLTSCDGDECVRLFNEALANSVQDIGDKLTNEAEQLPGINPQSYYYYLTNGGETYTMISDIKTERTYAITYVATSDENKWSWVKTASQWTFGILGVVAGGFITYASFGTLSWLGLPLAASAGTLLISGGGAAGTMLGGNIADGADKAVVRPNNIMIIPVNSISGQCTTAE